MDARSRTYQNARMIRAVTESLPWMIALLILVVCPAWADGPSSPNPVSYRSMTPKSAECANLLVPVCVSSSHMAYGSIRMEPVFMILGQSAATAASLAIDGGTSVQAVPYEKLRRRLLDDRQKLDWAEPAK